MKKNLSIITLVVTLLLTIIYAIYNNKSSDFILFGSSTIVSYKNNEISSIEKTNKINKKLNYEEFNVYYDGKFTPFCLNFYEEDGLIDFNLYIDCYEEVSLNDYLLAYHGDLNINVASAMISYDMSQSDEDLIKSRLNEKGVPDEIIDFSKAVVDIDSDGKNETIYSVNNYSTIDEEDIYCYNFLVKSDGTIVDINLVQTSSNEVSDVSLEFFAWAVDIDFDNNYEVILSSNIGDDSITYFDFYKYNEDSFSKIEGVE